MMTGPLFLMRDEPLERRMMNWSEQMQSLMDTASFISRCDVIDIHFDNGHVREVYLASKVEDRQQGLAGLPSLDTDGMLFVFASPSYVPFDMSNMLFDLEIAWYDHQGTLLATKLCHPGDTVPVCSPQSFSYVLEAPVGTIPTTNLKVRY